MSFYSPFETSSIFLVQKFKSYILRSFTKPGVLELKLISGIILGHINKLIFPSLNFKFSSNNGNVVEPNGFYSSYYYCVLYIINAISELYDNSLIVELKYIVSYFYNECLLMALNVFIGNYN